MTRKKTIYSVAVALMFLVAIRCGTVASVRPIGAGESCLVLSSGGPVAPVFDIKMPIPYTVLRYRRGVNDNTDFHLGFHPTMMILGNVGMDVGLTKHLVSQSGLRPAFSFESSVYGFYHVGELSSVRVYPEISIIGSYCFSERRHVFYFGAHSMMQFAKPNFVIVPFAGFEIPLGLKIVVNLETKWYAPSEESEDRVVDYTIKPMDYGAIGFVWGLSYRF